MSCTASRSFTLTVNDNGDVLTLPWNRSNGSGDVDDVDRSYSNGQNLIALNYPTTKQDGTANDANGRLVFFWTPTNVAPTLADNVQEFELGRGDRAEINVADFRSGFFWVKAIGAAADVLLFYRERKV